MDPDPTHDAVRALHGKYAELIALRQAHAAGAPHPPRAVLRDLAERFPGALRELDLRTMGELTRREQSLRDVVEGRAVLPPWALVQIRFHALLRVALWLKPILADGAGGVALAQARVGALPAVDGAPGPGFWDPARLSAIARPRGGRLSQLIAAWAAEICGVSEDFAVAVVFQGEDCPDL